MEEFITEGRELANNVTALLTRGGLISTGVCTMVRKTTAKFMG